MANRYNSFSGSNGYYYRLLNKGQYAITFRMDGYEPAIACVKIDHVPNWNKDLQGAKILNAVLFKSHVDPTQQPLDKIDSNSTITSYGDSRCGDLGWRIEAQQLVSAATQQRSW